jgi:hypothetical protein
MKSNLARGLVVGVSGAAALAGAGAFLATTAGPAPHGAANKVHLIVAAVTTTTPSTASTTTTTAITSYAVNALGETYGSAMNAQSPTELPDLVLVRADNGKLGYITRAAFLGPQLTPSQVVTLPTDGLGNYVAPSTVVPVFAPDGVRGQFKILACGQVGVLARGQVEVPTPL